MAEDGQAGPEPRAQEPEPQQAAAPALPRQVPWGTGTAVVLLLLHLALQTVSARGASAAMGPGLVAELSGAGLGGALALLLVWALIGGRGGTDASAGRLLGFGRTTLARAVACWRIIAVGALGVVVVWVATLVLWKRLMGGLDEFPVQHMLRAIAGVESPQVLALAVVVAVVVAPLIEEVLYRSVLYLPLRERLGVLPAALVVSLLFAVVHFYVLGVAVLAVLSLIFIALFERSRTLWAPVLAHAAYNGLAILLVRLFDVGLFAG